jgi:hypothetical protein
MVNVNQAPKRLERVYEVVETAIALCRHPVSIHKATLDMLKMPIPRFVNMGSSILFSKRCAISFFDDKTVDPTPLLNVALWAKTNKRAPTNFVAVIPPGHWATSGNK